MGIFNKLGINSKIAGDVSVKPRIATPDTSAMARAMQPPGTSDPGGGEARRNAARMAAVVARNNADRIAQARQWEATGWRNAAEQRRNVRTGA